jgi:hypothetical protein
VVLRSRGGGSIGSVKRSINRLVSVFVCRKEGKEVGGRKVFSKGSTEGRKLEGNRNRRNIYEVLYSG